MTIRLMLLLTLVSAVGCTWIRAGRSVATRSSETTHPTVDTDRRVTITVWQPGPGPVELGDLPDLPEAVPASLGDVVLGAVREALRPAVTVEATCREQSQGGGAARREAATAQGATILTPEAPESLDTSAPPVSLPSGPEAGGGESPVSFWERARSTGSNPLFVMGGLAVLAGTLVLVWLKQVWTGLGLAAGGAALIAAGVLVDRYPWVALAVPLVGLAAVVWFLLARRKGRDTWTALRAIVVGVEEAEKVEAGTKREIAAAATAVGKKRVDAVVDAIKKEAGLEA